MAESPLNDIPLGKDSAYPEAYDPGQLFPILRGEGRAGLGLVDGPLPFGGVDIWNAYEVSWLGPKGKPQAAVAQFRFLCDSPAIVESKSFKLYLNSLNQHTFASREAAQATMSADLSKACGAAVVVRLFGVEEFQGLGFQGVAGRLLDDLDIEVSAYVRTPDLLENDDASASESLYTNLFKSNCPVTGQPDWASVFIEYSGKKINEEALLAYLISFRNQQDFHEHCVEQIYLDIMQRCEPDKLTVFACFLRRGGLDINPFRSNHQEAPDFLRVSRQ